MALGDWPKNLTTFSGGFPGKALLRGMEAEAGGMDGIRRVERRDPDGTVHALYTRAGMPTVITTKPLSKALGLLRTFVFSVFGSTTAVVANKAGSGLATVRAGLPTVAPSYAVGALKTDTASKWSDVARLDGTVLMINGKSPAPVTALLPDYGRAALPYVAAYQASCDGDTTRSPLFVGQVSLAGVRVASVAVDGAEKSAVTATPSCESSGLAGAGVTPGGEYQFYAGDVTTKDGAATSAQSQWRRVQAGLTAPYMTSLPGTAGGRYLRYGTQYEAMNFALNYTGAAAKSSAAYSVSPTLIPFYALPVYATEVSGPNYGQFDVYYYATGREPGYLDPSEYLSGGSTLGASAAGSYSATIPDYGYTGSPMQLALTATLQIAYTAEKKTWSSSYSYYSGGSPHEHDGGGGTQATVDSVSESLVEMTSPIGSLFKAHVVLTQQLLSRSEYVVTGYTWPGPFVPPSNIYDYWITTTAGEGEVPALVAQITSPAFAEAHKTQSPCAAVGSYSNTGSTGGVTTELTATTRDYIFADLGEEVYLYLDSALTQTRFVAMTPGAQSSDVFELTLKYVLDVRGTKYDFEIYKGADFESPEIPVRSVFYGVTGANPGYDGYTVSPNPVGVFSPPFMSQGNCPYIAYTTKAEEAAGATPECYVDFSLSPMTYLTCAGMTSYDGTTRFVPHQFTTSFQWYLAGLTLGTEYTAARSTFPNNPTLWNTLFPPTTPFRLQFANGVKGPWASQLGAGFEGDPVMDISRI